jgi:hypothetical protein
MDLRERKACCETRAEHCINVGPVVYFFVGTMR